jgi:hypothetical protein
MSEQIDGDRITVRGYSAGSHFPRTQAATHYRFEANGLSSEGPFHIDGVVYGRELRFRGPGSVLGPVLGRGDITLHNHGHLPQRFLGGLHASGTIGVTPRAEALQLSLVADIRRADYVIRGDVVAENVTLENAIVVGNVRARHIRLCQCVVLGEVVAGESLRLEAVTFARYRAREVTFAGACMALFTMGMSDTPPKFEQWKDGAGNLWPPDLRFYPAVRGRADAALSCRPWTPTWRELGGQLSPEDWKSIEVLENATEVIDGVATAVQCEAPRYVFTIAGRALNFAPIQEQLTRMVNMLRNALEFDHYSPSDRQATRREWDSLLTQDEALLLRWATDTELPKVSGRVPTPDAQSEPAPSPAPRPVLRPLSSAPLSVLPSSLPTPPPVASAPPPVASAPPSPPPAPSAPPPVASALPPNRHPTTELPPIVIGARPGLRPVRLLLADGTKLTGALGEFNPSSGQVAFFEPDGKSNPIPLSRVLVIVAGLAKGGQPRPRHGTNVTLMLNDGRALTGHTTDVDAQGRWNGPVVILPPLKTETSSDWIWVSHSAIRGVVPVT